MSIAKNVNGLQAAFGLPPHNTTLLGVKRPSEIGIAYDAYPTLNKTPKP
jgi:hypothetical protein